MATDMRVEATRNSAIARFMIPLLVSCEMRSVLQTVSKGFSTSRRLEIRKYFFSFNGLPSLPSMPVSRCTNMGSRSRTCVEEANLELPGWRIADLLLVGTQVSLDPRAASVDTDFAVRLHSKHGARCYTAIGALMAGWGSYASRVKSS